MRLRAVMPRMAKGENSIGWGMGGNFLAVDLDAFEQHHHDDRQEAR